MGKLKEMILVDYILKKLEDFRQGVLSPKETQNKGRDYINLSHMLNPFETSSLLSEFLKEYDEMIKKIPASKNGGFIHFTEAEYMTIYDFFSIVRYWIKVTKMYPRLYNNHDDIFSVFHNYLKSLNNRIIVRALQRCLIKNTIKILNKNEDIKSEYLVRQFGKTQMDALEIKQGGASKSLFDIRNEVSSIGYHEGRGNEVKSLKKVFRKRLHSCMLTTLSVNTLDAFEKIDDFKKNYYIGSPRVRTMKVKAHKIIEKIFDFFMENEEMLPIELFQKIDYNTSLLLNMETRKEGHEFEKIVYEYLNERLREQSPSRNFPRERSSSISILRDRYRTINNRTNGKMIYLSRS
jgi:hypothetical protein